MERRPHPDFDRTTWRRVRVGLVTLGLTALGCWAVDAAGGATVAVEIVGGAGFLTGAGVILSTPANRTPCPRCGVRLAREAGATEFPCAGCGVAWVTRSSGYNVLE